MYIYLPPLYKNSFSFLHPLYRPFSPAFSLHFFLYSRIKLLIFILNPKRKGPTGTGFYLRMNIIRFFLLYLFIYFFLLLLRTCGGKRTTTIYRHAFLCLFSLSVSACLCVYTLILLHPKIQTLAVYTYVPSLRRDAIIRR